MLMLNIDPVVFSRFPEFRAGGFLVAGLDRARERISGSDLGRLWAQATGELNAGGVTIQNISDTPNVMGWRTAFGACGVKPSTFKSSPEALARRVLKGGAVVTPLDSVNLYCAVSARHLAPIGGYDLDTLPSATVEVRPGRPGADRFDPLGGNADAMPVTDNTIVYACEDTICCYLFNHRDSRSTCLRTGTTRAAFLCEAVTEAQYRSMLAALEQLREEFVSRGAVVGLQRFVSAAEPSTFLTFNGGGGC